MSLHWTNQTETGGVRPPPARRALGCGEDEDSFKAKPAVIARQKPKQNVTRDEKDMASVWDADAMRASFKASRQRLELEREALARQALTDPSRRRWHDEVNAKAIIFQQLCETDCLAAVDTFRRKLRELRDPADFEEDDITDWFKRSWARQLRALR